MSETTTSESPSESPEVGDTSLPERDDSASMATATAVIDRDAIEETVELIRPALQMDGGDVALLGVSDEGDVELQLHGACVGCPASLMTLKAGIERIMKDRHPEVREVIAVE